MDLGPLYLKSIIGTFSPNADAIMELCLKEL